MAPRKPATAATASGFNLATLVQMAGIPVLSAGLGLVGWYYLTSDTLRRHDEAIKTIQIEAKASNDIETKSRDEARKVFLDNQLKTAEVLGQLNTRLAVSETKQEVANQTLSKIADQLSRIGTGAPSRGR